MEYTDKLSTIRKCIQHGMNVLVIGHQGIGKTQAIQHLVRTEFPEYKFIYTSVSQIHKGDLLLPMPVEEHGRKWVRYIPHVMFSPYDEQGQPRRIVLALDEFNRNLDDPDVYNLLLEVLWSRSLNGVPLDLQCVVAMANPDKDNRYFNTTQLETAVLARFPVKLYVDMYDLGADRYLLEKYPDHAPAVIEWVLTLPEEKRWLVPPRTQEHIIQVFLIGEPIRYVFTDDVQLPISQLEEALRSGNVWTFKRLLKDPEGAAETIRRNSVMLPLFVSLLRLVKNAKDAERLKPVLRELPEAIRIGLWSKDPRTWTKAITEINGGKSLEMEMYNGRTDEPQGSAGPVST